jgi:hypothetical protein
MSAAEERHGPRTLREDLGRLQEGLDGVAREADRRLRDAVSAQPLLVLGAAAGLGFVLGRTLPRGSATLLLGAGARLASAWLEQEFLGRADAQEKDR